MKEELQNMLGNYIKELEEELYIAERTIALKQQKIDKAINNCKKSIESINQKLLDNKEIKISNGQVLNMNDYQIVRLKAVRMKCKEILELLGDKE